jgi:hypothetical protein
MLVKNLAEIGQEIAARKQAAEGEEAMFVGAGI